MHLALRSNLAWQTTPTSWIKLFSALWGMCNKICPCCVCEGVLWMWWESVSDIKESFRITIPTLIRYIYCFHVGLPTLGCGHIFSHWVFQCYVDDVMALHIAKAETDWGWKCVWVVLPGRCVWSSVLVMVSAWSRYNRIYKASHSGYQNK